MSSDLRARIAAALANTASSSLRDQMSEPFTRHGDGHSYDGSCALCRGEVETLTDAVMAIVEKSLWNAANTDYGKCNSCNALVLEGWARRGHPVQPHKMTCRWYVGPLEHRRLRSFYNTFWQKTEYECTCGGTWREDGDGCPNAAETWRGPKPDVP